MATPKPVTGIFPNTMAYARSGNGAKTLLLIPGGPGNDIPTRQALKMIFRGSRLERKPPRSGMSI